MGSKHILVTGGAGYIGSVLTQQLLEAGHEVTVLDNLMYGQSSLLHLMSHPQMHFVRGDARDGALLKKILPTFDVIIPLAAIVGAPACDRAPITAQTTNYDAIVLIDKLRAPHQKIIYPTTNSGYGTKSGETYCTEDTALEPISLYGQSKVDAEQHLIRAGNAITLRLATVFGVSPRMRLDLLVNDFVYKAVKDRYLVIFEKDFKRNYIHIKDVARVFLHCINNFDAMKGQAYNAGLDDANLSKEKLALKIKEHVPSLFIQFAEIGSDPDKRNYIVSNAKLAKTGFVCKYSIDDGITELVKAYQVLPEGLYRNA